MAAAEPAGEQSLVVITPSSDHHQALPNQPRHTVLKAHRSTPTACHNATNTVSTPPKYANMAADSPTATTSCPYTSSGQDGVVDRLRGHARRQSGKQPPRSCLGRRVMARLYTAGAGPGRGHGPLLLNDNIDTRGLRTTAGSRRWRAARPPTPLW